LGRRGCRVGAAGGVSGWARLGWVESRYACGGASQKRMGKDSQRPPVAGASGGRFGWQAGLGRVLATEGSQGGLVPGARGGAPSRRAGAQHGAGGAAISALVQVRGCGRGRAGSRHAVERDGRAARAQGSARSPRGGCGGEGRAQAGDGVAAGLGVHMRSAGAPRVGLPSRGAPRQVSSRQQRTRREAGRAAAPRAAGRAALHRQCFRRRG
jgi:hypothetical protein